MEPGPDRFAAGMVQFFANAQGLLPRVMGGRRVAGDVVGVADVGEGFGLPVEVAELAVQGERTRVAIDGLSVVGEVVVGIADTVPGDRLAEMVVEFAHLAQGILAAVEGLLVGPELGVRPADIVERPGRSGPVSGGAHQFQQLNGMAERRGDVTLPVGHAGEILAGAGLAHLVAKLPVKPQSFPQLTVGVPVTSQPGPGEAEVPAKAGLAGLVNMPLSGGHAADSVCLRFSVLSLIG